MRCAEAMSVGLLLGAVSIVGCTPVVEVRHKVPGGLPLREEILLIRAGAFTVRDGPAGDAAAFLKDKLEEHLKDIPLGPGSTGRAAEITDAQIARVGGTIELATKDTPGRRTIRRLNRRTGQAEPVELPTLVRTAEVRVAFRVEGASGEDLGTVEVHRSYHSAADADVRGDLGLRRADDPEHVPDVQAIVRRLLTECTESFCRTVAPVEVTARIPLRAARSRAEELALAAARRQDYPGAVVQLRAAVAAAPDHAEAHFNLGATAEATGKLDLATSHYTTAWELSDKTDTEAQGAAARARRVLRAHQAAAGPTSAPAPTAAGPGSS